MVRPSYHTRLPHEADVTLDLPEELCETYVDILFLTIPYYVDRPSRRAVEKIIEIPRLYPPHTSHLVNRYAQECTKKAQASSNALVLLEWGSYMLWRCSNSAEDFKNYGHTVYVGMAQSLDVCLGSKAKLRRSITARGLHAAARAIACVARSLPKSGQSHSVRERYGCRG